MKRLLLLGLFLLFFTVTFSQKKSELLIQLKALQGQIKDMEQEVMKAKREAASSNAKAEALETENMGLRDANASLLHNLGSFSELSKKNSENVTKTLAALERKEKQLTEVNAMIAANDSITIVALAQIKQQLGANARMEETGGVILIYSTLHTLFGSDTSAKLTETGKVWLAGVAEVILAHSPFTIQVEGLNITGEFEPTFDQATAVAKELASTLEIPAENLVITVKDGNFREGIHISLQPNYKEFYNKVKKSIKRTTS